MCLLRKNFTCALKEIAAAPQELTLSTLYASNHLLCIISRPSRLPRDMKVLFEVVDQDYLGEDG